ncbi:hypothetical protein ACSDBR_01695 [Acidithiobacillus ferriphilus]|uniref:hypothetical protein n=1 Tax=Acidithiobacillus ferriphilus TaxID=1689834 RepID=UPI003F5123B4
MKKTLFVLFYLFFLIPACPFLLNIPVVGDWMVGVIVLGPLAWGLLWLLFVDMPRSSGSFSGYTEHESSIERSHRLAREKAKWEEDLARSDWRFDHGRMYHSRDHWD